MSKRNLPKPSAPDEEGVAPRRRMTGSERREQLLEEAVRLFAEKGFDGASIEEIAHRANVSKPVVYEHFGGKESIYAVVIDRELQRLMLIVESTIGDPLFQQNRLMAHVLPKLISALFEYAEERANGFRVLIDAPLSGSVTHQKTVVSVIAHKVEEVLSAAGWAGEIARTYAQAISGMLVHSAAEWLTSRLVQRTEIVDHLIDIALHGVALIDEPWSRRDVADLVIYTSANDGSAIRDAMLDLLEIAGWAEVKREYPQLGSWYQRLWIRGKDSGTLDKLADVASKLERSLELKHIAGPRSENDEREAAAIERAGEGYREYGRGRNQDEFDAVYQARWPLGRASSNRSRDLDRGCQPRPHA